MRFSFSAFFSCRISLICLLMRMKMEIPKGWESYTSLMKSTETWSELSKKIHHFSIISSPVSFSIFISKKSVHFSRFTWIWIKNFFFSPALHHLSLSSLIDKALLCTHITFKKISVCIFRPIYVDFQIITHS